MQVKSNDFIALSEIAIADNDMTAAVQKGTGNGVRKRLGSMFAYGHEHGEAMRQQAAEAKRRALRDLPELLEQAEQRMTANGINVLWAIDAAEARKHVLNIEKQHNVERIAKSKSMATEEIALNHALADAGLDVVETDLGEWILQLNNEAPSHIVTPVIHKSKESIRDIFVREAGMRHTDDAVEMASFAREQLRRVFLDADMGISGGNFVIAETGSIGFVMNEGNGRMVTSLPRVHVALIGIEKVCETVDDYATLTQVLPRSGTGQNLTVYTHLISGPRRTAEDDGPDHVYVIFLDNGRSDIYATDYAEALACIRCGACLNTCPVYQSTGGHAYGWVYGGPIGSVLTPLLTGLENATPLPHASSLCGSCKEACPVDIDLPRMLIDLRADIAEQGLNEKKWDFGLKAWAFGNQNPLLFSLGGKAARITQQLLPIEHIPGPHSAWAKHRDFPQFAQKPFRQLWKERQNGKS